MSWPERVAPVTKRSGKTHIVVMRYAAHVRLRQAVVHWARVAILHDPKSRSRYDALRQCGQSYWSRPTHRRQPVAGGCLRPFAAAGAVRPRS
jgi:Transposase IS116/IS110/IS902 family